MGTMIDGSPTTTGGVDTHHSSTPEVAALIGQLKEKDKLIERLERETEHHKALRETEDHLVTTAFYNLGMQLQRQAMDQRIASSGGANQPMPTSSPSVAQGFLTRQRQTSIRGRPANINHQGENF